MSRWRSSSPILVMTIFLFIVQHLVFAVPLGNSVDVFVANESGYYCIKIPSIFLTQNGSLLAFGEARRGSCSDFAVTDLVVKRSEDDGQTWSKITIVAAGGIGVAGNGTPLQNKDGRVLVPYCHNNSQIFLTWSEDDGITWQPQDSHKNLTEKLVLPHWKWVGLGPPGALQLQNGRILIPSYHTTVAKGDGLLSIGHVVLSDDGGLTWRLGCTDIGDGIEHFPNEAQAVELDHNNTILINARSLLTHRLFITSHDGGETFGKIRVVSQLKQPITGCEGSFMRHSSGTLLYSGPAPPDDFYRVNMTVFVSFDQGENWHLHNIVDPGPSAYSSLCQLKSGTIGLLYERSDLLQVVFVPKQITFVTFNI